MANNNSVTDYTYLNAFCQLITVTVAIITYVTVQAKKFTLLNLSL